MSKGDDKYMTFHTVTLLAYLSFLFFFTLFMVCEEFFLFEIKDRHE